MALHDHNEAKVLGRVIGVLECGESVALVSDAGTPLVNDPGFRLVRAAHEAGISVSPVPGASALIAALSVAGLPTDRFCFEGFPPSKRTARKDLFTRLLNETRTMIFFESVHRIGDCLKDMSGVFGADRAAFIGRELTKLHEQCVPGSLGELLTLVDDGTIVGKGEFVVVVTGCSIEETSSSVDVDRLLRALKERMSDRDAAKVAAAATGCKRNDLYERLLRLKPKNSDDDWRT
jgi:16S rRNA (cytidine1402-2'-O)-methyltransferase